MADPVPDIRLPRASKGQRPHFFEDPSLDQMMTFFLELMAETSTLRDRVDTIERLLETKASVTRSDLENFCVPPEVEAERTARRKGFIERVLRMHAPD